MKINSDNNQNLKTILIDSKNKDQSISVDLKSTAI